MKRAASLILCKPSGNGLFEVLMVKRSASGTFKSLHAFPGGAVEASDSDARLGGGGGGGGAALRVAALREAFEECGALRPLCCARHRPRSGRSLAEWQARVRANASEYVEFVKHSEMPVLPISALVPWSHWITPATEKRRFDTHFFLAAIDTANPTFIVAPDDNEVTETEWLSPSDAIAAFESGRIRLIPPQFITMLELQHYTFKELCEIVRKERVRQVPHTCQPEPFLCEEDGRVLLLPGDLHHSATNNLLNSDSGLLKGAKNRLKLEVSDGAVTKIKIIATGGNNAMGALKLGNSKPKL
ncbi:NUDIX domain-containing protein [Obelidium mucronatum]|nr:NUDIX domain-containing protein [Obelidium mucronatum]